MSIENLVQRVAELDNQYNNVPKTIINYLTGTNKNELYLGTIERYAHSDSSRKLIHVAFYRQSDSKLEDLDQPGFCKGDSIDIYVGRVIEKYIKLKAEKRDYNQKMLADAVGTSPSAMNKYIKGKLTPSIRILEAIGQELGLEIMYLVPPEKLRSGINVKHKRRKKR